MRRLGAVVAISLAGFVAAVVAFDDAARQGCVAEAPADSAYRAAFEQPVQVGGGERVLLLSRAGWPLTDVEACVTLQLADAPATTTRSQARQLGPGRFEVSLDLDEPGTWRGRALITPEPGADPVAVPLEVRVAPSGSRPTPSPS